MDSSLDMFLSSEPASWILRSLCVEIYPIFILFILFLLSCSRYFLQNGVLLFTITCTVTLSYHQIPISNIFSIPYLIQITSK